MKILQKIAIYLSRWLPKLRVDTRCETPTQTIHFTSFNYERKKLGLTIKEVAKRAKVSEKTVREIEKDYTVVGLDKVYSVAESLNMEMTAPSFGFMSPSPTN